MLHCRTARAEWNGFLRRNSRPIGTEWVIGAQAHAPTRRARKNPRPHESGTGKCVLSAGVNTPTPEKSYHRTESAESELAALQTSFNAKCSDCTSTLAIAKWGGGQPHQLTDDRIAFLSSIISEHRRLPPRPDFTTGKTLRSDLANG